MPAIPTMFRGPLFMIVSTGSYLVNDTAMKLAAGGLPPYEVLILRGVAAMLWGIPLLCVLGYGKQIALILDPRVLLRNLFEMVAVLAYIVALSNMQIADSSALMQLTPVMVMIGASLLFRERVGGTRMALIVLGFGGALMVAQPTMAGVSVYALLALATAAFGAARDLSGRRVAAAVPGMVVAVSAVVVVLAGGAVAHLATERWVTPEPFHLMLLAAGGFFLIFGHFFLFMAYRVGPTGAVAPFYYCFTIWALLSGVLVFGEFPDTLALAGAALIVASGIGIVMLGRRRPRLPVEAEA